MHRPPNEEKEQPGHSAAVVTLQVPAGIPDATLRLIQTALQANSPVLLPDRPIHRRGRIHYVWWPDQPAPDLVDTLAAILADPRAARARRIIVLTDWPQPRAAAIQLTSNPGD